MRPRSLAGRVLAAAVLAAALPVLVAGAVTVLFIDAGARRDAERYFEETARLAALATADLLEAPERLLEVAAAGLGAGPAGREALLRGLLGSYPALERIDLIASDGRIAASSPPRIDLEGNSLTGADFFRRIEAGARSAWSPVSIDARTGMPTIVIAVAAQGSVLAGTLDLSELRRLVSGIDPAGRGFVAVVDSAGKFVAHPDPGVVARRESAKAVPAIAAVRGEDLRISERVPAEAAWPGSAPPAGAGGPWTVAARSAGGLGMTVAVFRDSGDLEAPVRRAVLALGASVLAAVAASTLLAAAAARGVARPVRSLVGLAARIGAGDYGAAREPLGLAELDRLGEALGSTAAKVALRESELRASLREKEAMAQEINHRVKNNLAVLLGLLSLAGRDEDDPRFAAKMADMRRRVYAMAAAQEMLYAEAELASIDMRGYLGAVAGELRADGLLDGGRISVLVEGEALRLPVDRAVPLGLIANELLTNAARHAFPDGRRGTIVARLALSGGDAALVVSDDGVGLDEGGSGRPALGLELVRLLAGQLGGAFALESAAGLTARVDFPVTAGVSSAGGSR